VLRLLRVDPLRVEREERVLRALRSLRVIGTLPEPVRVEPPWVLVLAVVAGLAAGWLPGAAMPQTLQ
jgi:hypothetical protein